MHSYDAIVVGTGISGGWAAKELCENGLKTLVLERVQCWCTQLIIKMLIRTLGTLRRKHHNRRNKTKTTKTK